MSDVTLEVNEKLLPFLTKPQPIKVAIGGRGCISGDTLIDTPQGKVRVDCFQGGEIYSLTDRGIDVTYAEKPIKYAPEQLYKVTLSNGLSVQCTDQHRFLTPQGWQSLSTVHSEQLPICVASHLPTSLGDGLLGFDASAQHCFQRLAGFLYSYFWYHHQYDRPLPLAPSTYRGVFQQLTDELQRNCHTSRHVDDREFWNTRNPSRLLRLLSSLDALLSQEVQSYAEPGSYSSETLSEQLSALRLACRQFHERKDPQQLILQCALFFQDFGTSGKYPAGTQRIASGILGRDVGDSSYSDLLSCNHSTHYITLESCVETTVSYYYDFFVPIYNNYLSNGVINHNSGKSLGVGDMLTFEMSAKGYDIYCLREFQDSVIDSVHKVFKGAVEERLQLDGWDIQQNAVIAPNGAKTTYKGANRNPDAMQSAQGYLRSWFEEAHRASQASLDKLLPTIIRNPGAQCWFTANPQSSADPFSQRFIVPYYEHLVRDGYYEDEMHYIVMINWRDNPWWNEEQERLRKWDFEHLSRAKYDWIWEGAFMDEVEDSIILPEWFDAAVDAHIKKGWKPRGKKIVAFDPADQGGDAKGLAYRHGSVVLDVQQTHIGDINGGCDWATDYCIQAGIQAFIWDADGPGVGLRRQISDGFAGHAIEQVAFRGGRSPDNPDTVYEPLDDIAAKPMKNKDIFKNCRSQYYWALRDRFYKTYRAVEHGEYYDPDELISIPKDIKDLQQLRSEVCRIPRKPNGNGLIQIVSKPDMKKLDIESPNMADALMMSLAIPDRIGKKRKSLNIKPVAIA